MPWIWVWLAVTVLALIIEFSTSEMVSVWFVCGGVTALVLAVAGVSWPIQLGVFVVLSILSLLLFRHLIMKYFNKDGIKTNVDSAIGKEFTLLEGIDFGKFGAIKINDVVWTAQGKTQQIKIEAGKTVKVMEIRGNKFIVEEV